MSVVIYVPQYGRRFLKTEIPLFQPGYHVGSILETQRVDYRTHRGLLIVSTNLEEVIIEWNLQGLEGNSASANRTR
jgi:hypothetical protein